jgi:hypothetical protein
VLKIGGFGPVDREKLAQRRCPPQYQVARYGLACQIGLLVDNGTTVYPRGDIQFMVHAGLGE